MYKSILLPTDGSALCERAIAQGVALAKQINAKLVAVTVSQPLHIGIPRDLVPENLLNTAQTEIAKQADVKLASAVAAAKAAGVPLEAVKANHDHPWEAIIQTANEKGCDLIVMASHGRRGISAALLGSETQKVLAHSKIPVLIVR